MSFKSTASTRFPNAVWTGGSHIHTSIARAGDIPYSMDEPRKMMAMLTTQKFSGYIYRTIQKHCNPMEWLMTLEEFDNLLMVDFYRLLQSKPTHETPKRLRNPKTGNWFHRVALAEDVQIVGGVRVWLIDQGTSTNIGWRFRLESMNTEAPTIRGQAIELVQSLEAEVAEIKEYVAKEVTIHETKLLEKFIQN